MESMRSLNRSLPSSQPNHPAPPEQLLQAFRTAALSVTNLYKSAAANQASSRQAGYQDALDDLLQFLDRENLGLQDGEGWRVRQWATERYDGSISHQHEESDEDAIENDSRNRTVSPVNEQTSTETTQPLKRQDQQRGEQGGSDDGNSEPTERPAIFQFTAGTTPNNEHTMQTDESRPLQEVNVQSIPPVAPLRVEVLNRAARNNPKHSNGRHNTRSSPRDFTFTSGTKRKMQFPDFFDISNMGLDKRDGFGGGGDGGGSSKRGRVA